MRKEQCSFVITDEEAKIYKSFGENAIVYASKLAKDYDVTDKDVVESRLLEYPRFYRLQVTY